MTDILLNYGVGSYVSKDILIVSFQSDFYQEVIEALENDILCQLHAMPELKGLVIDVNNIKIIDLLNINTLEKILSMTSIFGVISYLTGLKPQITLALIDLGYEPGKINTALNIEQAIKSIHQKFRLKKDQNYHDENKLFVGEDCCQMPEGNLDDGR